MYADIHLHEARSYISYPGSPFSLISSLTLSNHLMLGLPLVYFHFHRPPSYAVLPTLRITCPYHFNLLSWTFFPISPTFVVPLIPSFLILPSFVTPHIHHSIRISAASNLFSCGFFNAHVSAPYTSAGLTTVLFTISCITEVM